MSEKKIDIKLVSWDYTCGDGCCTDYGTKLVMNGEELDHPDGELIDHYYVGDSVELALRAVLGKLGYEVTITEANESFDARIDELL